MNTQETVREARARQQMATQPNWTTRLINSSQLKSKQNYQRNINTAFVQKIVTEPLKSTMILLLVLYGIIKTQQAEGVAVIRKRLQSINKVHYTAPQKAMK